MHNPAIILSKAVQRTQYNAGRVLKEAGLSMDRFGSRLSHDIAYLAPLSRHRQVLPLYDQVPKTQDAWIAPNATLVGDVFVSKYATVWYGAVLRGERHPIRIGHFSSIGDGCTVHTNHSLNHGMAASVNIGKNVTIEANCNIHSCIIDDDCVIGHGSIIEQGARLERGCQILAGSVVKAGSLIPAGQVWGGSPAVTFVRNLTDEEMLENYSKSYTNSASEFSSESVWGHKYDDSPASGQSLKDYTEEKYFKVNH